MDSEHLRLFVATARLGNLTRAAAQVAVTQSTATRWLQALQREAGGRLVERAPGGVRLTVLGQAFLPYAQRSVRAVEDGLGHLRDVRTGGAGKLLLGCSEVTSTYFLPRVLHGFRSAHPTADVAVRTGPSRAITEAVAEGDLEIAFVATVEDPRLDALLMEADALVTVAAPQDPLLSRAGTGLTEVAERGLILYGVGEAFGPYGMGPFLAANLAPRIAMEVDNVETAKRMVAEGFGMALLPWMAVQDDLEGGRLAVLKLDGVDLGHWHVRMVRRARPPWSALAEAFWAWCAARASVAHLHQ